MKDNILTASLKLNKKQSPTDRRVNTFSLICAALSIVGWAVFAALFIFNANNALMYYGVAVYFIVLLTGIGAVCSVRELIRNPYFDTILALVLLGLSLMFTVATLIWQAISYSQVFIFPYLPV